jgi:hypothetical protein
MYILKSIVTNTYYNKILFLIYLYYNIDILDLYMCLISLDYLFLFLVLVIFLCKKNKVIIKWKKKLSNYFFFKYMKYGIYLYLY